MLSKTKKWLLRLVSVKLPHWDLTQNNKAPNFATPTYSIKIYKLPTTKILQLLMSIFCLRPNCRSVSEEKPSHLPTPSWTQSTDVLKTSTLGYLPQILQFLICSFIKSFRVLPLNAYKTILSKSWASEGVLCLNDFLNDANIDRPAKLKYPSDTL